MMKSLACTLVFLLILVACTPIYTADSIERYSENIGVVDHFKISRWHHYLISQDSRLAVAGQTDSIVHASFLAKIIDQTFSQYYADVTVFDGSANWQSIIDLARRQGCDFLFHAELLSTDPLLNPKNESQQYKNLTIIVSIVDANTALVVDKILLSSSKTKIPFIKGGFDELLYEPFIAIAKELVGA